MPLSNGTSIRWCNFIKELQDNILPIYQNHENTFDPDGIHGRMHICRTVLFAEYMGRFYQELLNVEIDMDSVQLAVAFHDSGREGNGKDLWEEQSAKMCNEYARENRPDWGSVLWNECGSFITSHQRWRIEVQVVKDADVLEIMRPCCGHGGIDGFRRGFLRFLGKNDDRSGKDFPRDLYREGLIKEAWEWIEWTEKKKFLYSDKAYMDALLNDLQGERNRFPILAKLL